MYIITKNQYLFIGRYKVYINAKPLDTKKAYKYIVM